MTVDFGRTAGDYAAFRTAFPNEFFSRLGDMGIGLDGQRVVDVGTGTGAVARGFARRGCIVTGLDPAPAMLEQARRLDAEAGVHVVYRTGRAEQTGLDGSQWDVVSAGQSWHWFDRPRAAAEARRLLITGGALVICHMDYLPLEGNVCAVTEALICEHNRSWTMAGGTGIHPDWTVDAAGAGFTGLETFSFDLVVPYSHEAWRGRMRSCNGVGATLSEAAVRDFDVALSRALARSFPDEPLAVPHRVWALIARAPG
ncbi:MAG TPA: class I SAM-dependent methyltransferase [Solirubrobacteraceae bacterium]|jgi:SAM-dependent methyltransferase|nr:class I SAM-dependent methyltransferase [Solirubrobacteraceae bacterium]